MSGHGLTSCAAIDDSRKVEYVHRQYRLQNTLHRNLQPLQRALTSANERSLPPASSWTCAQQIVDLYVSGRKGVQAEEFEQEV